jgi:hypothetical protein
MSATHKPEIITKPQPVTTEMKKGEVYVTTVDPVTGQQTVVRKKA